MSREREVVILSAVRTAIGKYGGTLKDHPPTELAAVVLREAVKRAGVASSEVGHVVFGHVIHTDVHDMYLSRVAAIIDYCVNNAIMMDTSTGGRPSCGSRVLRKSWKIADVVPSSW